MSSENAKKKSKGCVIITGASAGVGRACARRFAKNGYDVGLIARGKEGLEAAVKEAVEFGVNAAYYEADVANYEEVESAALFFQEKLGFVIFWINNAMTSVFSPVRKMEPQEYKRVTDVTYLGQVHGALVALKLMNEQNKGSIVFVGSALAYRGIPLQSAYCAAKHATKGFVDSLRTELLHDKSNINISMVQLPALNTTQFGFVKTRLPKKPRPMGKIYQPEVAAEAILYAAENTPREIKVGVSTIKTIIGNKIAPWYADRVLAKSGIEGQQTNEPEDSNRPNNLWKPIPGDHGAHGAFNDQALVSSTVLRLRMHGKLIIWIAISIIIVVFVLIFL
ncbi:MULTISPECIES: SDR family oxidoreductase [Christiangramia]|uniref:3-oxoacyl-[acyl-carrier protein] reductase n=1 Tax=Christiangramia flava JLT2011 TaxID=1229726 RepID=A0A1L7IAP7_9FLAO|nr:SDR family oxidoreductase [Christiangramia flava]APU70185.1 3-oxoacyl-[acyl-carrier protein] reductase [Christiangramia flava JLT2011]OSS39673.1 3-oxoacyl-[acyl-carrier protein] reductase [Christiangramia flava JLT2011]